MRFRAFVLSAAVLLFGVCYTSAQDAAYAQSAVGSPSFGAAIGAAVAANAVANGFSVADPRVAATIAAIGAQAASIAAGIAGAAGGAVSAVPWIAVAAEAGLGAMLGAVPVSLGDDTLTTWLFNKDGTVTVGQSSGSSGSSGSPFPSLSPGDAYWSAETLGVGSSPEAAMQAYIQYQLGVWASNGSKYGLSFDQCSMVGSSGLSASCSATETNGSGQTINTLSISVQENSNWTGASCSSGMYYNSACQSDAATPPPPPPPVTESPSAAAANTASADDGDLLNPTVLAGAVNALWSEAAVGEGYGGLPYPVNAPVSAGQAGSAESGLGSAAPTVGSVVSPAGSLSGASSTAPFTASEPATSNPASSVPAATDPGSGAQVNLGPDPGIGSPTLEATPTAAQILAPILNLLPDLRSWVVPSHASDCPEPTFDLWGTTYTFTEQCDLLNQYQPEIYGACVAAFTVAALLIVLTA